MRFRHLHSMTPAQRMDVLEAQFPAGHRSELFEQCQPGEYERLFRDVPGGRVQRWSSDMTAKDQKAWVAYNSRTNRYREQEQAQLAILRPPLDRLLTEHPYSLDDLLALPRLLGDPIATQGVRLYFRREAFTVGGEAGVFERVYKPDELVVKLTQLQRWGAAPFLAVQGIPYGVPRTNSNVRRARVFSVDWDAKHEQYPPESLLAKYPPDLFVQSGGGYHAYWRIPEDEQQGLGLTEWRKAGLALARALNADEDAVLGTQLMRLPGSIHMKNPAEPRRVRILTRYEGPARTSVFETIVKTFQLELRDEDIFTISHPSETIDVDPEEHAALARVLTTLQEQGLQPRKGRRGWQFFCPCHETAHYRAADVEDGEDPEYTPKQSSTPSGILRVNADRSLALFCGSTKRCGAGPREILEALGLHRDLVWLECGGFLKSDYGRRFKAARMADGTWESDVPDSVRRFNETTGV